MPSRIGDALCWHATLASLSEMTHVCEQLAEQDGGSGRPLRRGNLSWDIFDVRLIVFPAMARR